MRRIFTWLVLGGVGLFLAIQLVPYGRDHTNPPVTQAAVFKSPKAQQLVADSCNDCHSNLTKWPWYTNVAPASWLVMNDVDGGRKIMNLSEWDKPQPELDEVAEMIDSGEMPPLKYKVMPNHSARAALRRRQEGADRRVPAGLRRPAAVDQAGRRRLSRTIGG